MDTYSNIACILALLIGYAFYVALWRIYSSPLAHFPGPALAAFTYLQVPFTMNRPGTMG